MSVLPPVGVTWLVHLECQGVIAGFRFLDGNTLTGDLKLVDAPTRSGARWTITSIGSGAFLLRCQGTLEAAAPPGSELRPTARILDGRTLTNSVALISDHPYLLSGSRWEAIEVAPEIVTIRCLGHLQGNQFLDGNTITGSVQLAPSASGGFTGARWRVRVLGAVVTLQCMGKAIGGPRFLQGQPGGRANLAESATATVATLWLMNPLDGALTFRCLGDIGPDGFLDGRTLDGSVGLAPSTGPPFSGTRWEKLETGREVALRCLGSAEGLGKRFLDGITPPGLVALAPHTDLPFSGTHWHLRDAGVWWVPCRFPVLPATAPIRALRTERLGQLTGGVDPQRRPLLNCPTEPWGVAGVDLGANAEHSDGRLYFFFGDVRRTKIAEQSPGAPPHDSDLVAWTTARSAEEFLRAGPGTAPNQCAIQAVLRGNWFAPFTVGSPSSPVVPRPRAPIGPLLSAETPTGAFSYNDRMFVFVWIGPDHSPPVVTAGSHLVSTADPSQPLRYTHEFMLSALDGPKSSFSQVAPVVVNNAQTEGLPLASGMGCVIFGQGNSVAANSDAIHLAWMPLIPSRRPRLNDILYHGGDGWGPDPDSAIPLFALERKQYTSLSAAWLSGPKRWILVYSKSNDDLAPTGPIVARFGAGLFSWSDEVELFNPCRDQAYGKDGYMHWPEIDEIHRYPPYMGYGPAAAYGAFLIDRFTQWEENSRQLHLYYLLSLFRPYQVQLMRTTVRFA